MVFARAGQLNDLWEMFRKFILSVDPRITIDIPTMAALIFSMLCGWIGTVTAAYLGDVIAAALLSGKRFSGLVSFILIMLLLLGISAIDNLIARSISSLNTSFWVQSAVSLACSGIMYVLTAQIMERKLSV